MNYNFYGWQNASNIEANGDLYKGIETPLDLYDKLTKVWCADTCTPRLRDDWSPDNKTLGQCSITAFIFQDIFGGEVYAMRTENGGLHCYNVIGENILDLTSEQYSEKACELVYDKSLLQDRDSKYHFAKAEKKARYEYIKSRLEKKVVGHFYYARHGQTVWNVENKICGATDSPLTELGKNQARELGHEVVRQGIKIDEIIYSPLSRARDTALEISKITGIPARMEPRLIEQNFGKWESTPRNGEDFGRAKQNFISDYEGGESMLRLCQRIYNLIDDLKNEPEKVYLLVAHNGISRAIESYFTEMTNEEFGDFGIRNCEIRRYDF